jgi:hypothetical protein
MHDDTTTIILLVLSVLLMSYEPPWVKKFRENRQKEQLKPEKYHFA